MKNKFGSQKQCLSIVLKLITLVALTLFFSGCAKSYKKMYDGPEMPSEKIAKIEAATTSASIVKVDNKFTRSIFGAILTKGINIVDITPGKHDLVVSYKEFASYARAEIWLVASAGHTYILHHRISDGYVAFLITDKETGEIIGGYKGSSDEPD